MQHGVDGRVDVAEPEEEGVEPTRDAARRAPAVDQVDGEEAAEPIEVPFEMWTCGAQGAMRRWAARISPPGEGAIFDGRW